MRFIDANVFIYAVLKPKRELNMECVLLAEEKRVSINDALAYISIKRKEIEEIYTFDKHFENLNVRVVN